MSSGDKSSHSLDYKLSCIISAHELDVRCLDIYHNGFIVSGSRDKSVKLWEETVQGLYSPAGEFHGSNNFIYAVLAVPPSASYPVGLIVTGSGDKNIYGFVPGELYPVFTLRSHTDTVSDLCPALASGFFSASWDKTAKLWDPVTKGNIITYSGHKMAVWCVLQLPNGLVITGSADKAVKIFLATGEEIATLTGHEDCVRGLCHVREDEFLTCSNDGSIRMWNSSSRTCLNEFKCHPNYIYSVCRSKDGLIASCGEDSYVNLMKEKDQLSLILPCQSVWSVKFLANGDLVTGCSDGIIRIFTLDESRFAPEIQRKWFEEEVKKMLLKRNISEISNSDLSPPSVLERPGTKDGQLVMVSEGGGIKCYKWSLPTSEWVEMGDVMGKLALDSSGKKIHNGKEYDFVFDVDIDGKPALKLPYNKTEDPYQAAHSFLIENNLNVSQFLDQVAKFIIDNVPKASPATPYFDPLTGSSRYIPVENAQNHSSVGEKQKKEGNSYFPQTTFLRFDTGDVNMIINKLREFNDKQENPLGSEMIQRLHHMTQLEFDNQHDYYPDTEVLLKLLHWPADYLYPVLDILRLAVRDEKLFHLINSNKYISYETLMSHLHESSPPANQIMTLRLMSNLFAHKSGRSIILAHKEQLMEQTIKIVCLKKMKQRQVGISTFLLNMFIAFQEERYEKKDIPIYFLYCDVVLLNSTDSEAIFRILVALGTLLNLQKHPVTELPSQTVEKLILLSSKDLHPDRVAGCAQAILSIL